MGEVVVRKKVVTETKSVDVPVSREEVTVERRPVNEPTSDTITEGEQEIRVPVMEEQVVVEKRPVVREEVRLDKKVVQDTEHVSDQVMREEVEVEEEGAANLTYDDGMKR